MPPRAPRRPLVLVEREDDWPFSVPELEVLPARTYVAGDDHPLEQGALLGARASLEQHPQRDGDLSGFRAATGKRPGAEACARPE